MHKPNSIWRSCLSGFYFIQIGTSWYTQNTSTNIQTEQIQALTFFRGYKLNGRRNIQHSITIIKQNYSELFRLVTEASCVAKSEGKQIRKIEEGDKKKQKNNWISSKQKSRSHKMADCSLDTDPAQHQYQDF